MSDNSAQLEIMRTIHGLTSVFRFKGNISTVQNPNVGDIAIGLDGNTYFYMNNKWEKIGGVSDNETEEPKYTTINIKKSNCDSCGAPIKIKSKYDKTYECEYCGTTYLLMEE